MNRIIKFRGKRLDNGEWVYGDLEYNRAKNIARIHTYDEEGEYLMQHSVDPDTAGQFTGLYGRNRKEIYEGDVIVDDTGNGYEVRWYDDLAYFVAEDLHTDVPWPLSDVVDYDNECGIEIIGNIHDNPELLNEK